MVFASFERFLSQRSPSVRERIERLNPNRKQGERIRGWHPTGDEKFYRRLIGKQEFLKRYTREQWAALPNGLKYKYGRRKYIALELFVDGLPIEYRYLTKRYANDPKLWVEPMNKSNVG